MSIEEQQQLRDLHAEKLTIEYELVPGTQANMFGKSSSERLLRPKAALEAPQVLPPDSEATVDCDSVNDEPEVPVKRKRPFKRAIQVFYPDDVSRAKATLSTVSKETRTRMEAGLSHSMEFDGWRCVPSFRNVQNIIEPLSERFGNFKSVLEHLSGEMLLSGAGKPDSFQITPILLDGEPGVGKTAFAQAFAESLGLPFIKLTAGGMQHAATLTGTSSHWANAQTGEIYNLIARSAWATGVLLIDEADKLSSRSDYSILPALLDLLEPESARNFRDESLGLQFDASRLIVLMTSNNTAHIDDALLSRCRVFCIEVPGVEQKRLIALHEFDQLNKALPKTKRLRLDLDSLETLVVGRMDVRFLIKTVRHGHIKALKLGKKVSVLAIPEGVLEKPKMGFL
jgi:ATP-dependent Lon protease